MLLFDRAGILPMQLQFVYDQNTITYGSLAERVAARGSAGLEYAASEGKSISETRRRAPPW
jgi:hypothetical protein